MYTVKDIKDILSNIPDDVEIKCIINEDTDISTQTKDIAFIRYDKNKKLISIIPDGIPI